MFEVRVHGRGGQGVATAAELLSVAAFLDGREAQAYPSFGSERVGAGVVSHCRVGERPIRLREPVSTPDAVIVVDATLLNHVAVFAGLTARGFVLVNSTLPPEELGLRDLVRSQPPGHVVTVPATALAHQYVGRPLPSICLLGAFAALTGVVTVDSVERAVRGRFAGTVAEANVEAAHAAALAAREVSHA